MPLDKKNLCEIQQGLRTGVSNSRVFSTAQALDALLTQLIDSLPDPEKNDEQSQQGKGRRA